MRMLSAASAPASAASALEVPEESPNIVLVVRSAKTIEQPLRTTKGKKKASV